VLEAEGRLSEAYAVRGQIIESLSGYIEQVVGPALDYAAVSRTHRAKLTAYLAELVGQQVQAGPFHGMVLPDAAARGDGNRAPKFLGTYEQDIVPALIDFAAHRRGLVINVGCSEGYYAVVLARLLPQSRVVAFDGEERAREICAQAAELNGVSVDVVGRCTPEGLAALLVEDPAPLIVMDCEGDEVALLDPVAVPHVSRADIIVACHDFKLRGLQEALLERLAVTHDVEVVRQGARNPQALAVLQGFAEQDRWLLMSEGRTGPGCWLVCRARRK
jgi:precorrin-6B methylase 2